MGQCCCCYRRGDGGRGEPSGEREARESRRGKTFSSILLSLFPQPLEPGDAVAGRRRRKKIGKGNKTTPLERERREEKQEGQPPPPLRPSFLHAALFAYSGIAGNGGGKSPEREPDPKPLTPPFGGAPSAWKSCCWCV